MTVANAPNQHKKPIIAVCGGTGTQGGSVVRHLLEDGFFSVRVLTRNPRSPQAKNLTAKGVRVVRADYDDPASLRKAFAGAHGVFAMTDYYECGEHERQQGINLVDAAKEAGVRHFIWSATEHTPQKVPSFETKADVDDYLRASGLPRTSLFVTFYFSNIFLFGFAKRSDGGYNMDLPFPSDCPIPCIAPADIGGWALHAFLHPEEWIGKDMKVCGQNITPRQFAETFEEVSGVPVSLREVSHDEFLAMERQEYPFNLWLNMKFFYDNPYKLRDAELGRKLHPQMQDWRAFALDHLHIPPKQPLRVQMMIEVSVH